ncbi:MAG: SPOR domain-containing protein [Gammaproteobacteria bacterium]
MPRDYKHRAQRGKQRAPLSPWLGLLAGLLIGLFVAFLVYIRMQETPAPAPQAQTEATPAAPATKQPGRTDPGATDSSSGAAPPRPRFDFYTLLPEMEVVVPEREIKGAAHEGIKQVEEPGTYFLQVGSFSSSEQADRFKAELTLLGLDTSIQKVTINNADTYHRVRVGPYHDLGALNQARKILNREGIEGALIRIKS